MSEQQPCRMCGGSFAVETTAAIPYPLTKKELDQYFEDGIILHDVGAAKEFADDDLYDGTVELDDDLDKLSKKEKREYVKKLLQHSKDTADKVKVKKGGLFNKRQHLFRAIRDAFLRSKRSNALEVAGREMFPLME